MSTLATSVTFLNKSNSHLNDNFQVEWILDHFVFRFISIVPHLEKIVDHVVLLLDVHHWLLDFLFIILLLLAFGFLTFCLLFFLLVIILDDLLLELNIDWNSIVLSEVSWYRDFNERWIVLEIKEKLIQMNVDGVWSWIVDDQILFELTDSRDCAFNDFFDEHPFLWVHYLIIAVLESLIDIDVPNVEHCQMLEELIRRPSSGVFLALLIFIIWHMLDLNLLL